MRVANQLAVLAAVSAIAAGIALPARAQDAAHGEQVFHACAACHAKDHTNRLGPGLQGVVGRTAGSVAGFRYSRAMKSSGVVWDEKHLDDYITAPQKAIPGNTMPFAGIANAKDRADLFAYLETLK